MEEYELEHTGCARQEAVLVRGGNRLCGELTVQGAKNSTLPLLAAALLCEGETVLHNCPALSDVHTAVTILRRLGCRCTHTGDTLTVCADGMTRCDIPHSLMREMRSSIVFLGAILSRLYTEHDADEVHLVYSEFVSMTRQVATALPLLPVVPTPAEGVDAASEAEYVYEPEVGVLLAELLPRYVNVQVYRGLLDTSASENAARMGVRNVILYHTEDDSLEQRRRLYTEEGRRYFGGNIYVPDDLERIPVCQPC